MVQGEARGTGPVRLPPTQPPKRRRKPRPRWFVPLVLSVSVVLVAVTIATVLNREVSKRLATVPPASARSTTTSVVPAPAPPTVDGPTPASEPRTRRPSASTPTTATPVTEPPVEQADTTPELIEELDKLPVEEEHPSGYSRLHFGYYEDADRDGCETRREVVLAEAQNLVVDARTHCEIKSATWFSPYDGKTVSSTSSIVVDHLVALREVWESGAWRWTNEARNAYLNDLEHPEVMLVVTSESQDARDDRDPRGWLPPYEPFRCDYLKQWVYLKSLYQLSVDPGEREQIARAALHCN